MDKALCIIGMWCLTDAVFSISIYHNKTGYHGEKQTWARDHWVRCVRGLCGIALMIMGYMI